VLFPLLVAAQPNTPLTLSEAVRAAAGYPSVTARNSKSQAADSAISLANTSYLPKVDGLAQLNRATRNNVFGLLLPQSPFPSISGPVLGTNDLTNVWGSALGVTAAWEPFDFGLRRANVAIASSGRDRATATVTRAVFRTPGDDSRRVSHRTRRRSRRRTRQSCSGNGPTWCWNEAVGALTNSACVPGGDLSRAQAERAIAETQVRTDRAIPRLFARARLSQLTGLPVTALVPGHLLELPPSPQVTTMLSNIP
jgi:outer membrane protein TolC